MINLVSLAFIISELSMFKQTDRGIDRQKERHTRTDRQIERQIERQTGRQTYRQNDIQIVRRLSGIQ